MSRNIADHTERGQLEAFAGVQAKIRITTAGDDFTPKGRIGGRRDARIRVIKQRGVQARCSTQGIGRHPGFHRIRQDGTEQQNGHACVALPSTPLRLPADKR